MFAQINILWEIRQDQQPISFINSNKTLTWTEIQSAWSQHKQQKAYRAPGTQAPLHSGFFQACLPEQWLVGNWFRKGRVEAGSEELPVKGSSLPDRPGGPRSPSLNPKTSQQYPEWPAHYFSHSSYPLSRPQNAMESPNPLILAYHKVRLSHVSWALPDDGGVQFRPTDCLSTFLTVDLPNLSSPQGPKPVPLFHHPKEKPHPQPGSGNWRHLMEAFSIPSLSLSLFLVFFQASTSKVHHIHEAKAFYLPPKQLCLNNLLSRISNLCQHQFLSMTLPLGSHSFRAPSLCYHELYSCLGAPLYHKPRQASLCHAHHGISSIKHDTLEHY